MTQTPIDPNSEEFRDRLHEFLGDLELMMEVSKANNLAAFVPYPKQKLFFKYGATMDERLLIAGNQLGKTEAGAYETSLHLTGLYPPDWEGKRWDRAVSGWACGVSGQAVRDTPQKKMFGAPGVESAFGTGLIPKHLIIDRTMAKGTADLFDTVHIRHVSGGVSRLVFKSYEQGRGKFQSDTLDFVWLDEEAPEDIYTECIARTAATNGIVYTTFTPLMGKTTLIIRFFDKPSPTRAHVTMTVHDAPHITPEMLKKLLDKYPVHEHDARLRGIPILGSGRVWPYPDDMIMWTPIVPPTHWRKIWGLDFGIGETHPFAASLCFHDTDLDHFYVYHSFQMVNALPPIHVAPIKAVCINAPVAWPHDGANRDKQYGEVLISAYSGQGLKTLPERSQFEDGSTSPQAGVDSMGIAMREGRFKVNRNLSSWFDEFREYHYKDGLIVKTRDHELDATRCAWMSRRFGKPVDLGGFIKKRRKERTPEEDIDFDPFMT